MNRPHQHLAVIDAIPPTSLWRGYGGQLLVVGIAAAGAVAIWLVFDGRTALATLAALAVIAALGAGIQLENRLGGAITAIALLLFAWVMLSPQFDGCPESGLDCAALGAEQLTRP